MFHVKICSTHFAIMLKDKSFSLCFMKAEVVHGRILLFFPSTCADTQPFFFFLLNQLLPFQTPSILILVVNLSFNLICPQYSGIYGMNHTCILKKNLRFSGVMWTITPYSSHIRVTFTEKMNPL